MQKKITKRALLVSLISLLLCSTMLIGSTFAWFTDSAATSVNKIEAGRCPAHPRQGDHPLPAGAYQGYDWRRVLCFQCSAGAQ